MCECGLEHDISIDEYEQESGVYGVADINPCICGRSIRTSIGIADSGDLEKKCGNCGGAGLVTCQVCEGKGSIEGSALRRKQGSLQG